MTNLTSCHSIPTPSEIQRLWNDCIAESESPLLVAERLRFNATQVETEAISNAVNLLQSVSGCPVVELDLFTTHSALDAISVQSSDEHQGTIALPAVLAEWALLELAARHTQGHYTSLAPLHYFLEGDSNAINVATPEGFDYLFNHFCNFLREHYRSVEPKEYPHCLAAFITYFGLEVPESLQKAVQDGAGVEFRLTTAEAE